MFGAPSNGVDFTSAFARCAPRPTPTPRYANDITVRNANGGTLSWNAATVDPYLTLSGGTNVWRLTSDQLGRIGTITFRSMPSDATLLIVVTDWTTRHLEGPELLRHRRQRRPTRS